MPLRLRKSKKISADGMPHPAAGAALSRPTSEEPPRPGTSRQGAGAVPEGGVEEWPGAAGPGPLGPGVGACGKVRGGLGRGGGGVSVKTAPATNPKGRGRGILLPAGLHLWQPWDSAPKRPRAQRSGTRSAPPRTPAAGSRASGAAGHPSAPRPEVGRSAAGNRRPPGGRK